uniref:Toxin candidate TRINITY_DN25686_c0_g1_i1 n=1 Tax=Pachycerianthus borealis TaxID=2736680 RepID=A0A7G7WYZ5_9CNID|nr:toxin candidate TRINITY_DN25686_c0_g1_i1 [Pachycerianthus borealis]
MKLQLFLTTCLFIFQGFLTTGQDIDLLTSEGQEGWLQSLLQSSNDDSKTMVNIEDDSKTAVKDIDVHKRTEEIADIQELPMYKQYIKDLDDKLPEDKATMVKSAVNSMTTNWKSKSYNERHAMASCLQSAARHVDVFLNTKDDPVRSIQAGMEIVGSFAMVVGGPYGQAIGAALSFVSAFLSVFGKGKAKPEPMDVIVKKQIDNALAEFYELTLTNEASGAVSEFQLSKAFLDGVRSKANTLSDTEANALASHVPVYGGVKFMGILASEIEKIKKENPFYSTNRVKCLKYIELYAEMADLKTHILQEMAALLPDSHSNIRNGVLNALKSLHEGQKSMIKFLYESDYTKYMLANYIPSFYPSTDQYALKVLKISDYDRTLSGTWCLKLDGASYLKWGRSYSRLMVNDRPYTTFNSYKDCYWMLVPHGKNLFSIVNNYHCPGYDFCYSQLNWSTISSGVYRAYMKETGGVIWEITKSGSRYRIRNKWGCNTGHSKCDLELGQQQEVADYEGDAGGMMFEVKKPTGGLLPKGSVGYKWQIIK